MLDQGSPDKEDKLSSKSKDLEKGPDSFVQGKAADRDKEALFSRENMATFRLMQDSMNYTSFDQEKQCMPWLDRRMTLAGLG